MRAAATSRWRDNLTARITAFTFEKVNGIFAARCAGYSKDDSSYRRETVPGPRFCGAPPIAELTQICDIEVMLPVSIAGREPG